MTDTTILSVSFPDEHAIYEDSLLKDAIQHLALSKEEMLPVWCRTQQGKILGIITPKSILAAYEKARKRNFNPGRTIHIRKRGIRIILHARERNQKKKTRKGKD